MPNQKFMVTAPHTKEECLAAADAVLAKGKDELSKWDWGCMAGDHTAYATIEASSPSEALRTVPDLVRHKARAVPVIKLTEEQIVSFHK